MLTPIPLVVLVYLFGFMTLLGLQPPALTRSSDINTLGGGVAFYLGCAYHRSLLREN